MVSPLDSKMIDGRTLLQVNATMIAGLLVFVTISSFFASSGIENNYQRFLEGLNDKGTVYIYAAFMMLWFTSSSVRILNGKVELALRDTKRGFYAIPSVLAAFGILHGEYLLYTMSVKIFLIANGVAIILAAVLFWIWFNRTQRAKGLQKRKGG